MDVKKVMYLIIKCTESADPFVCDYDRKPVKVVSDYTPYNKKGYEVYEISTSGALTCIRNADKVTESGVGLFRFKSYNRVPDKVLWKKPNIFLDYIPFTQIKEWFSEIGINLDVDDLEEMSACSDVYSIETDDGEFVLANYEDDDVLSTM